MPQGTLTNAEHEALAEYADDIARERRGRLPRCPFCRLFEMTADGDDPEWTDAPVMEFRHGNIHRNPIAWGQNRKCPECYFLIGFGVPLYEDEFEHAKELMGGREHYNGKPREDLAEQEVQEQLSDLGYLEM